MSRILYLSSIYPRSYDPTRGLHCFQLCKALAAEHDLRVFSPRPWPETLTRSILGDAPELANTSPTEYPTYAYPPRVLRSRLGWFMWMSVRQRLRRVMAEFRPDCVLSYWAHPDGEVAVRAARLTGIPAGIIVGGSDVLLLPRDPARGRAVAKALREADAVFAVSRDIQNRVIRFGIEREKIHVVRCGVDSRFTPGDRGTSRDRLGLPRDGTQLLWVGRLDPVKGLEVLIASCGLLASRGVSFRLTLVGDGPARASVERLIIEHRLTDRVHMVGVARHEALPDWYRAADLTVLSSHSEGIPNVLRESLACGTPYVATQVGGVPELSDDPAVRLAPPSDPIAFADAIELSLNNRLQLSKTNLSTWQEYAQQVMKTIIPAT